MKHQIYIIIFIISCFVNSGLYAQWESIGAGINTNQRDIFSLSVVDENIIWAVPVNPDFTPNYEFTRTTDGGIIWEEGSLPDTIGSYYPVNIFALNEQQAWIIMVNIPEQNHIKIFMTEDGGNSWEEQVGEFNEVGHAFAALHFFNENEGIGFGSPGTDNQAIDSLQIFRTDNGGDSWNRIPPSNLPSPLAGEGVWVYSGNNSYEIKGDTLWFVTRASRVFRSVNKGVSWEAFEVGISGSGFYLGLASIAFENSLNGIAVSYQPNKAARTNDGGETWSEIDIPVIPRLAAIEYIPGTENTYLTNDGYIESSNMLLTTDGGTSWQIVTHSPSMDCMQFISPTIGYGGGAVNPGTDTGLFSWVGNLSDSITTHAKDLYLSNDVISLYPNPASEKLIISINSSVFDNDSMTIEIYSINGHLLQSRKYANTEKIEIPVANLAIGTYIIWVTDEEKIAVNTFIKE